MLGETVRRALSSAIPVQIRSPLSPRRATELPGCYAAAVQLRFTPHGAVLACCRSLQPLGDVRTASLRQIWDGEVRSRQAAALAVGDFSVGCQQCEGEIRVEGRGSSYPAVFDPWAERVVAEPVWPRRMEFNLTNTCNLQCVQCDGESSSAIRLHREHRPPIPAVYGDRFFDELRDFLPHLDEVVFGGGEPFLGSENFRVWDLMAQVAPELDCTIITNATQWNHRVRRVLDTVASGFVISLDGITPETYESIRIGADLERVLENVDRYREAAAAHGRPVSINHCLMPQNVHEFPELLLWAEERGMPVDISLVRTPAWCSIGRLPVEQIREIRDSLVARSDDVAGLELNRGPWETEIARLSSWVEESEAQHSASSTVMWFRCDGSGPVDVGPARRHVAEWVDGGPVAEVVIGADDLVHRCDEWLVGGEDLDGQPVTMLTKAVEARFGPLSGWEVDRTGEDEVHATCRFGDHDARLVYLALRDDSGRADEVLLVIGFRDRAM